MCMSCHVMLGWVRLGQVVYTSLSVEEGGESYRALLRVKI